MANQTTKITKIGPINRNDETDSELNNAIRLLWCTKLDVKITLSDNAEDDIDAICELLTDAERSAGGSRE